LLQDYFILIDSKRFMGDFFAARLEWKSFFFLEKQKDWERKAEKLPKIKL
jgi:hypothetical protein